MEKPSPRQQELFNGLDYLDTDMIEFYRADGNMVCEACRKTYYRHPWAEEYPSGIDDGPYLHRLCNGDLVKL